LRPLAAILIRLLSMTLLLGIYSHAFSQDGTVKFNNSANRTLCPRNNGILTSLQTSSLEISGPSDKTWYATYSVNGSPAENLNNGSGITANTFVLEISFNNNSQAYKDFIIRIEDAWLEDGTPLNILEEERVRTLSVYPLINPTVQAYKNVIKTNSELDYTIQMGMSSMPTIQLPTNAQQLNYSTEVIDYFQYINIRVKWQNEAGITTFKTIEKTGFGCNSDTIYSNIELKSEFSLDLGENKSICSGEVVTITPTIDLESDYTYLWSTGETTKTIDVKESGLYSLTVTDLMDNQKITDQVKITVHEIPAINIDDIMILEDDPILVNIQQEGCTYNWSTGETTEEISITSPGDFSAMITSEFGCRNSKSFTVKDITSFFTLSLPNIVHICASETMILSAYTDIDQEYKYLWDNGSTEKEIVISEEGIYTLTATDPSGFSQTASSQIIYHPNPIVDLGDDFILWDGESKQLDAQNTGSSYRWNTQETSQVITVSSGGDFEVNVIDEFGCSNSDIVSVDYREGEKFRVELGEDKSICLGDEVLIVPEIIGKPNLPLRYKWVGQNHTEPEIYLKEEGIFVLEVTDHLGNMESAQIEITMLPSPNIDLGEDIIDNPNKTYELIANVDNVSYNWSTGEVSKSIIIEKTGTYWVEVIDDNQCSSRDEINVKFVADYPFVGLPEAFSPNGDGHNDLLFVRGVDVDKIELMIYNRLGKKVFETKDINQGWDGYCNGQLQIMDSYYYSLNITYTNGFERTKTGNFALLK